MLTFKQHIIIFSGMKAFYNGIKIYNNHDYPIFNIVSQTLLAVIKASIALTILIL